MGHTMLDLQTFVRVAGCAAIGYILVILLVRLLGPRTVSKMNPSDFVITVALGSIVANLILSKEVTLAMGVEAIVVLLLLQLATEWISARFPNVRGVLEGSPTLLFYRGQFIRSALLKEHASETAVYKAVREQGIGDISLV